MYTQNHTQIEWILPFDFYLNHANDAFGGIKKLVFNETYPSTLRFSDWCLSHQNNEVIISLKSDLGKFIELQAFMTEKEYLNFETIWINFVDSSGQGPDLNLFQFKFNFLK